MADMSGASYGGFQDSLDQITRVLPTAAVAGFHFIAAQISPDSLCNENQVDYCNPSMPADLQLNSERPALQRIAFAVFTAVFSILCAILAVLDRQQAPKRNAAAAQSATQPPAKSPRRKKSTPKEDPADEQSTPPSRSRTSKRASAGSRQLQSASPTHSRGGRTARRSAVQSASPARSRAPQLRQTSVQALASRASAWAKSSMLQSSLRAVGSALTFAAFAILTPPGPTCLFGAGGLPQWLTSSVCVTAVVVFSALTKLPGFAPTVQTA